MIKTIFFTIFFLFYGFVVPIYSQILKKDTIHHQRNKKLKALIIPTLLVGYGAVSLKNESLKKIDLSIYQKLNTSEHGKVSLDNYTQFVPIVAVYGLNALGIKGKRNFKDRTIVLATSSMIMGTITYGVKMVSKRKRPRSYSKKSFPSGHTATAFMAAEFLRQEYKDVSVWYGVTGYVMATGTGFLRMYNNRHWFSDVITGAGVGILSVQVANWLEPFIQRTFFKKSYSNRKISAIAIPFYNGEVYGVSVGFRF